MPVERLRQKLRELGWIEGENLRFEYRFMEGQHAQYPTLAAELVALKVDVNVVWGTPAAVAAKSATGMIPVVVGVMGDVLSTGFVSNVARPGGNIIGSPA
jgi:putative ABC transport system substrate-binding protein